MQWFCALSACSSKLLPKVSNQEPACAGDMLVVHFGIPKSLERTRECWYISMLHTRRDGRAIGRLSQTRSDRLSELGSVPATGCDWPCAQYRKCQSGTRLLLYWLRFVVVFHMAIGHSELEGATEDPLQMLLVKLHYWKGGYRRCW